MPPQESPSPPDSALGLTNIHHATGLDDRAYKRVWESTRQAIERHGLELQGELSAGATSVVFDAREKVGGRHVGRRLVVKVIVEPENTRSLACFRREVKVLASEHVPTDVVPSLKHYQEVDDVAAPTVQPFLVAERIDGRPILDYVRDPRPLPMVDRITLVERCFRALERLHSCNLLHGDVSPNNVMVQKEDVVRLIDLGQAKPIHDVGTRSVSVAGGTPNYQPESVLRGEDRMEVWGDIHALASVAFHVLTDKPPGKKPGETSRNDAVLRTAGVPSEVAQVLLKALRVKDQRKETDSDLYASAADIARDLLACRQRQARRTERTRQGQVASVVALVVALPILALAWFGWSSYWSERRAHQTREIMALQNQASGLSHDDHPRVKELTARADQLTRDRDEALARGQTDRADVLAPELLDTLHKVAALRLGLERCVPLRKALGEVLTRTPWIDNAETIAGEHKALEQRFIEIGTLIERGETNAAWVTLVTLNADLAILARRNVLAAQVAEPRARLQRALGGLSAKLRERGAAAPAFNRLAQDADAAERAWKAGDWPAAERLFGLAWQALDGWLVGMETPEELAARRAAEGVSDVGAVSRKRELRIQVKRLEEIEKNLHEQVQGLQTQITRLTEQNLRDRDAYAVASKDLTSERTRRAAAETRAIDLSTTLGQEREAGKQTTQALAAERSAKEKALQAKATAEAERDQLRRRVAALTKTKGDLSGQWDWYYRSNRVCALTFSYDGGQKAMGTVAPPATTENGPKYITIANGLEFDSFCIVRGDPKMTCGRNSSSSPSTTGVLLTRQSRNQEG